MGRCGWFALLKWVLYGLCGLGWCGNDGGGCFFCCGVNPTTFRARSWGFSLVWKLEVGWLVWGGVYDKRFLRPAEPGASVAAKRGFVIITGFIIITGF